MKLPSEIQSIIGGRHGEFDTVGLSDSRVIIYDDMVLKIEKECGEVSRTIDVMHWLCGKVPTPEIIHSTVCGDFRYTLMSKMRGEMSCAPHLLENADATVSALADGMKLLWQADTADCPKEISFDAELSQMQPLLSGGQIDSQPIEPTFLHEGFENASALLHELEQVRLDYEPVLSHGDFCMPNIFMDGGIVSGFIDLGLCGISDKYRDITDCYMSLKRNFDGAYGGKIYKDFTPELLFEKLGIVPDRQKLRYYGMIQSFYNHIQ